MHAYVGVDVIWKGPNGMIEKIDDPDLLFANALEAMPPGVFPTLERIDFYTRTELPPGSALVNDITRLLDQTADPRVRVHLSTLLSLFSRAALDPETSLVFEGDYPLSAG